MKRAGISFLALTTLLCGLFFLTACKKGPLSLDQQFDVYSKAKPVSISDGETYYLWVKDGQDKTVDSLKYMIPKEWELDLEQSLKPNEDVAYTAQEDGRYFLVQIYTLRIQGNQKLSEKALKQTMMDDGHRFSKEGKVTIGDKEWLTGYERSEQANKASAISFYRSWSVPASNGPACCSVGGITATASWCYGKSCITSVTTSARPSSGPRPKRRPNG